MCLDKQARVILAISHPTINQADLPLVIQVLLHAYNFA